MSLFSAITKLWKRKNLLRDKITPFTADINKALGLKSTYKNTPKGPESYDYNVDEQNITRLGAANFNGGGYSVFTPGVRYDKLNNAQVDFSKQIPLRSTIVNAPINPVGPVIGSGVRPQMPAGLSSVTPAAPGLRNTTMPLATPIAPPPRLGLAAAKRPLL
jgi:hypothetical protein